MMSEPTEKGQEEKILNIFDVARYILIENGGVLSSMKLQKLCYYSQAWHLAWHNVPLFEEEFQAWRNGPVCRELYDAHSGNYAVYVKNIDKASKSINYNYQDFTNEQRKTINTVLEYYGMLDGADLVERICEEKPWRVTRGDLPERKDCEKIISNHLMGNYYRNMKKKADEKKKEDELRA